MHKKTYCVQLFRNDLPYQSVTFVEPSGYNNYIAVEVAMDKFIYYCEQASGVAIVPKVEQWSDEKRKGIQEFLSPSQQGSSYPELPIISFNVINRAYREKRFLLFSKTRVVTEKYISFTNGRHRSRFLEFAGAKKIWVYCYKEYVADLLSHCDSV